MDLVILIIFIAVILFVFKSFESFVYSFAFIDIFLRTLSLIVAEFGEYFQEAATFIKTNIPSSILGIFNHYSTGVLNTVLVVGYIIIFVLFEYYLAKSLFKKRRR